MKTNIYQIFYDEKTRRSIDPGFLPLDNLANPRADWREYWSIRDFFLNNSVNEDELYGFFSPAFGNKTRLSAGQVQAFIEQNPGQDVYTFSPFIQDAACYLNVFEHGNRYHPGHLEVVQSFLKDIALDVDLETFAMTFRSTVFCNYIVAKPKFWQTWFALTERVFEICEAGDTELAKQLVSLTIYRLPVGMKVFLVERIASLVLALSPDLSVCAYDLRRMPWSEAQYAPYAEQMMLLDKLKTEYSQTQDANTLAAFYSLRGAILTATGGASLEASKRDFIRTPKIVTPQIMYVCLADATVAAPYPKRVSRIHLGQEQRAGKVNVREIAPHCDGLYAQLGPLAGAFAVRNYLAKSGIKVLRVGICAPDQFVSTAMLDGDALLTESAIGQALDHESRDFFVSELRDDEDVCGESLERGPDPAELERFAAIAVQLGVLTSDEVPALLNPSSTVRGGLSLGVYMTEFWMGAIAKVEAVVNECIRRHTSLEFEKRGRSWALCAERLGSHLLLKHLDMAYAHIDWRARFFGKTVQIPASVTALTISI